MRRCDNPLSGSDAVQFVVARDPQRLYFGARVAAPPRDLAGIPPTSFAEGLWEHDVVELFLHDDHSSRYREFNLACGGRWWSALFGSYRECENDLPLTGATIWHEEEASSWAALIAVPEGALGLDVAWTTNSLAHVTAILTEGNTRHFLTYLSPPPGPPDFHRRELFAPLRPYAMNQHCS